MVKIFGILSILIVAICLAGCCSSTSTTTSASGPGLSVSQIKTNAIDVPYDNLFRENEKYLGEIVHFRGEILQSTDDSNGNYVFRLATGQSEYGGYYIDDIVWINYKGERYIEDDVIDVWGKVVGLKKYESIFGAEVTIPEITALHTELVEQTK